jgi:hypothetical protein
MYAAYRQSIDVPPLWSGIEKRIRKHSTFNIQHSTFNIAAAAVIAVVLLAAAVLLLRERPRKFPRPAAIEAAVHYRAAIAKLHSNPPQPLMARLTGAIGTAERAAALSPNDPVEATRLVAAYDAKLQLLRATADD